MESATIRESNLCLSHIRTLFEMEGCGNRRPLSTSGQCARFQQRYGVTGFLACGCQTLVQCIGCMWLAQLKASHTFRSGK